MVRLTKKCSKDSHRLAKFAKHYGYKPEVVKQLVHRVAVLIDSTKGTSLDAPHYAGIAEDLLNQAAHFAKHTCYLCHEEGHMFSCCPQGAMILATRRPHVGRNASRLGDPVVKYYSEIKKLFASREKLSKVTTRAQAAHLQEL